MHHAIYLYALAHKFIDLRTIYLALGSSHDLHGVVGGSFSIQSSAMM